MNSHRIDEDRSRYRLSSLPKIAHLRIKNRCILTVVMLNPFNRDFGLSRMQVKPI